MGMSQSYGPADEQESLATIDRAIELGASPRASIALLKAAQVIAASEGRDFITPDGFHITDKCRQYLSPLIAGEDYPPFKNGLPDYVKLKNSPVPKKLATAFKI